MTMGMIVITVRHEFIPSKHGMYCGYSLIHVEVSTEKIKCICMAYHQDARQNHDIKTANKAFENVVKQK
jgi:hypothetical protein